MDDTHVLEADVANMDDTHAPKLIRILLRPMLPKSDNTHVSKANVAKVDIYIAKADAAKLMIRKFLRPMLPKLDNTHILEADAAKIG